MLFAGFHLNGGVFYQNICTGVIAEERQRPKNNITNRCFLILENLHDSPAAKRGGFSLSMRIFLINITYLKSKIDSQY